MSQFSDITNWIMEHWYILVICALVIAVIYFLIKSMKKKPVVINRGEIIRAEFIKRNKINRSHYFSWLYHGTHRLGKIMYMRGTDIQNLVRTDLNRLTKEKGRLQKILTQKEIDPETLTTTQQQLLDVQKEIIDLEKQEMTMPIQEIVYRSVVWEKLPLLNPFSKPICIQISGKNLTHNYQNKAIHIDEIATFDQLWGIYYDRSLEKPLTGYIKHDSVFRQDLEQLSSIYYVTSIEQSTISDSNNANTIQQKQLDLEQEKTKRQHLVS